MELTFTGFRRHALLYAAPMDTDALALIDRFFEVEVANGDDLLDKAVLAARLDGKSVLIATRTARIDAQLLAALPYLKAVCKVGPSYAEVDLDACTRAHVLVTNTHGVIGDMVHRRETILAAAENAIAAFGFGRASIYPSRLVNSELRCMLGCCA